MKPEPKPKQELSVTKYAQSIALVPHSNDAKEFVLNNAPKYGQIVGSRIFFLEVLDGYDINEVAEYFQSYND